MAPKDLKVTELGPPLKQGFRGLFSLETVRSSCMRGHLLSLMRLKVLRREAPRMPPPLRNYLVTGIRR